MWLGAPSSPQELSFPNNWSTFTGTHSTCQEVLTDVWFILQLQSWTDLKHNRCPQLCLLPQPHRHAEAFSPASGPSEPPVSTSWPVLNTPVNTEQVSFYAHAQNSRRDKDFQGTSERGSSEWAPGQLYNKLCRVSSQIDFPKRLTLEHCSVPGKLNLQRTPIPTNGFSSSILRLGFHPHTQKKHRKGFK